uniref:Uncharacterized protein n=1 Tax=Nelumbo nucifera TaxID=4432 RepID=A0A822ZDR7_NELNU|nr:TPA_asm: hypothetical protein HUJ06_016154 [Nelumbo nucifera]
MFVYHAKREEKSKPLHSHHRPRRRSLQTSTCPTPLLLLQLHLLLRPGFQGKVYNEINQTYYIFIAYLKINSNRQ